METITVTFKNGNVWRFEWDTEREGFFYRTNCNTYQLKMETQRYKQVWVARNSVCGRFWYTDEARLRVKSIECFNGTFTFK